MEQKLAEFRARRQAERVVKVDQGAGTQPRSPTAADAQSDTLATADSQQPKETENNQVSTQSSQTRVSHHSVCEYLS